MEERTYDAVVIGAGAAGMAAALRIAAENHRVALIDREDHLGGILLQCIHNGFGLHRFNEELTGPEFAERFAVDVVKSPNIDVYLDTTVMEFAQEGAIKALLVCGPKCGVFKLNARAVVLAMGCRERNRGNLGIPGTRPAGVFTAGLAQRLINIEGYVPGKRVVIIGSGDIGLIMARRMEWVGAKVLAVVEILPHPSGITRNIVQCLNDFNIPLYLSHVVSKIKGRDRVEGVEITPLESGRPVPERAFHIDCDTVLLSVGLIPENELSKAAGVRLDADTGGPRVDARLMTSIDGVFACGNVLHVHDLVDWASAEATKCGAHVVEYLEGRLPEHVQGRVAPGANVKYVVPHRYVPGAENEFFMRALIVKDRGTLTVKRNGALLKKKALRHIKPAEMIQVRVRAEELPPDDADEPGALEIAIE